jgi:hypothetical protein
MVQKLAPGSVQTCPPLLGPVFIVTGPELAGEQAGSHASVVWVLSACVPDPLKSLETPRLFILRQKDKCTHWKESCP